MSILPLFLSQFEILVHNCVALQVLRTQLGNYSFITRLNASSDDHYVLLFDLDPPINAGSTPFTDDDAVQHGVGATSAVISTPTCIIVAWTRAEVPKQAVISPLCGTRDCTDSCSITMQWRATGVLGDALPAIHASRHAGADSGGLELLLTQAPVYLKPMPVAI